MPDVRFLQLADFPRFSVDIDWWLSPQHLLGEDEVLASAMIVALGTDAMAGVNDVLPDLDSTDRRGWWGDMDAEEIWGGWPVGSLLWLLERAKIVGPNATVEGGTVLRAENYSWEAMRPFVDTRIGSRVEVSAEQTDIDRIDVLITLYRGPLPAISLLYQPLWNEVTQ